MTVVTVLEGELLTDQPSITGTEFRNNGGYVPIHSGTRIYKMERDEFVEILNPLTHIDEAYYPGAGETVIPVSGYHPGTGDLAVFVNGVKQVPGVDYNESTTLTITLAVAASAGDVVLMTIGDAYSITLANTNRTVQEITAAGGETALTVNTYTPGLNQIEVFFNGSRLDSSAYTETNATTVTLVNPAILNDKYIVVFNQVSTVLVPNPAAMKLTDGVTAPAAISGLAQVYVDTADGNLKVKFQDSVVQTIAYDATAFAALDVDSATPNVAGNTNFAAANTVPTTITNLLGGVSGQKVTIVFLTVGTTIDFSSSPMHGNAGVDWTAAVGDFMHCTKYSAFWLCTVHRV